MKTLAAALVIVSVAFSAGCGSGPRSSAPAASRTTSAQATTHKPSDFGRKASGRIGPCLATPAPVERTLARNLVLVGARLSHARMVGLPGEPGFYFVSAKVSNTGKRDAVATWVVRGLDGGGAILAIDAAAALVSNYGGATGKYPGLTVDAPGVQKSRICAGGPSVDHGVTAPPPGGAGRPG